LRDKRVKVLIPSKSFDSICGRRRWLTRVARPVLHCWRQGLILDV